MWWKRQLSAPGSSTYSSNTLHVGDGTWDQGKDTFLLPNLVGLNFATMRYNGMANRFAGLTQYHQIILVHGVFAAITFLFVVPGAIFIARFYHRNARLALRLHIWLQITTVFLATVVLVLGWFAVGPQRSLTNPHHGIGVAIYVLVMFQVIFGAFVRWREKGKERYKIPLKLYLHQWLGRATALLAFAQIPLGLTLYGSPKTLFILYALWMFFLLLAYFILSYRHQTIFLADDRGSYMYSATDVSGRRPSGGLGGKLGALAAGGLGVAALGGLARRFSGKRRDDGSRVSASAVSPSRHSRHSRSHSRAPSGSYVEEEKYTEDGRERHTWRNRLLAAGATAGVLAAAKNVFGGRRRVEDDESVVSSRYHHPLGGAHSIHETESDIRRVEEGRAPTSPGASHVRTDASMSVPVAPASPSRRAAVRARRSGGSVDSWGGSQAYGSPSRERRKHHTLRDGVAALGVAGFLKHKWNQRKRREEDARVAEIRDRDREAEKFARMNSQRRRYTGDGTPGRVRRHGSVTESEMSPVAGSTPALSRHNLTRPGASASNLPPPAGSRATVSAVSALEEESSAAVPPPPPIPAAAVHHDSSGSEAYTSAGGGRHRRHHLRAADAAVAGAAGAATGAAAASRHSSRRRESSGNGSGVNSPPVSVKVKMHNGGRRVTLRRLDPAEAAAEREARRRDRRRRDRAGSVSSIGGAGDDHWRRVEDREAAQAAAMQAEAEQSHNIPPIPSTLPGPPPGPPPATAGPVPPVSPSSDLPPPPPIPGTSGLAGNGSPGSQVYDSSAVGSRADSNRRRRRAERARAEQAAREARGNRVDFT